jgi:hypothetical protein
MNINVTVRFGGGNALTRSYPVGTRVSQIINDPSVKAALGYGDNVNVLIDRRHVDLSYAVGNSVELVVETRANSKAADINVTLRFGGANTFQKNFPEGTTVGQAISDPTVRAALGISSNVRALIDRVEQDPGAQLENGDVVTLETVANAKAIGH